MMNGRNKNSFRFLGWDVYNDAQKFFKEILGLIGKLPRDLKYSLGDQIIRSSLSIVLNIAEGSGRGTDKELNRFFDIAMGSLNETVAALDALARCGYLKDEEFKGFLKKLESISRQLNGFKNKL